MGVQFSASAAKRIAVAVRKVEAQRRDMTVTGRVKPATSGRVENRPF